MSVQAVPSDAPTQEEQLPGTEGESSQPRQLRFDGMPIRDHVLVVTGRISLSDEEIAEYKAGRSVSLTVEGVVRKRIHHFREDKKTGERYIVHQATLQVGDAELEGDE